MIENNFKNLPVIKETLLAMLKHWGSIENHAYSKYKYVTDIEDITTGVNPKTKEDFIEFTLKAFNETDGLYPEISFHNAISRNDYDRYAGIVAWHEEMKKQDKEIDDKIQERRKKVLREILEAKDFEKSLTLLNKFASDMYKAGHMHLYERW